MACGGERSGRVCDRMAGGFASSPRPARRLRGGVAALIALNWATTGGKRSHFVFADFITGVTRGKRLVVLVGQKKAIAIAVRNVTCGGERSGRLGRAPLGNAQTLVWPALASKTRGPHAVTREIRDRSREAIAYKGYRPLCLSRGQLMRCFFRRAAV